MCQTYLHSKELPLAKERSGPALGSVVSLKIPIHPQLVNVASFGNGVFEDVTQWGWDQTGLKCALNLIRLVFLQQEGHWDTEAQTQGEKTNGNRSRECSDPSASQGMWRLAESRRGRKGTFLQPLEGAWPCWLLDASGPQTVGQSVCVVVSRPVHGAPLQQPYKLIHTPKHWHGRNQSVFVPTNMGALSSNAHSSCVCNNSPTPEATPVSTIQVDG